MWDNLFLILIVLNFIFILSIASSSELPRAPTVGLMSYYCLISVRECTWLNGPTLRPDRVHVLKVEMAGVCRKTWERKFTLSCHFPRSGHLFLAMKLVLFSFNNYWGKGKWKVFWVRAVTKTWPWELQGYLRRPRLFQLCTLWRSSGWSLTGSWTWDDLRALGIFTPIKVSVYLAP